MPMEIITYGHIIVLGRIPAKLGAKTAAVTTE